MRNWTLAIAWLVATVAAAAVGWLGVSTVMREAIFGPPQAMAMPDRGGAHPAPSPPADPPTATRPPSPPANPRTAAAPAPAASASTPAPTTSAPTSAPSPPAASPAAAASDVRGYTVHGGQVALALGADSASLVSATPASGYAVKVWRAQGWLRVDFTKDGSTSSVFATWNGHPPMVQTYES
ncbi:hypothetical protein ACIG0C_32615 [Kitasatospora aureofaciens]|uniref:Secreted protein n=1 Tax=Kitasatospora aureofaciens TaxID=1894 RepID=A0A1E7NDQ8_KITAU|nr:hypothetical protein [Kitasatospora aureofaciens]ARF81249.1 hypothetical protein B6264_22205 [Kitasatospora aureofaciens]OEV38846.1 hypothetical protein HS99_0019470 [Kitasatospora aureofaciens]